MSWFGKEKPPLKWHDVPQQVPDLLAEINEFEQASWDMLRLGDVRGRIIMEHHCQQRRERFTQETGELLVFNTHTLMWEIYEPGKRII